MTRVLHPRTGWKWQGSAGHFVASDSCRYHLCTIVGPWMVSTVGEYFPQHAHSAGAQTIGVDRLYETMVFRASLCDRADCCEAHQTSGESIDFAPANTRAEAEREHMRLCALWATREEGWKP